MNRTTRANLILRAVAVAILVFFTYLIWLLTFGSARPPNVAPRQRNGLDSASYLAA